MDIDRIKEPLAQFVQSIPPSIKVDQVLIFGSYVQGSASEDSDIDVVVISEDFKDMDEDRRLEVLHAASELIEPPIDPWGFTQDELDNAHKLSTLGHVRTSGVRFV